jgi:hypothetical protein
MPSRGQRVSAASRIILLRGIRNSGRGDYSDEMTFSAIDAGGIPIKRDDCASEIEV